MSPKSAPAEGTENKNYPQNRRLRRMLKLKNYPPKSEPAAGAEIEKLPPKIGACGGH
eukprot:UN24092